tara:strand:+ start:2143 stop:2280 length:138 start_codon:yes stop_codon:yes gene_type:complete
LKETLTTTEDNLSEAKDEIYLLKSTIEDLEEKLLKIPILETIIVN